jgi:hypothetical protein
MPNHILSHEDLHVNLAVVNHKGMPNELWNNRARTRPGFNGIFRSGGVQLLNLLEYSRIDKWTFLE